MMGSRNEEEWGVVGFVVFLVVLGYSIWHYILADGAVLP